MLGNLQGNPDHHHKFLDLLSAMAEELGYKGIPQTDLDKHYTPQGAIDQMNLNSAIQEELLRVLKSTNAFVTMTRQPQQAPQIVNPSIGQPPSVPQLPTRDGKNIYSAAQSRTFCCESRARYRIPVRFQQNRLLNRRCAFQRVTK